MLHYLMPLISSPWLYVIIFVLVALDGFIPVAMSEAVLIGLAAISVAGTPNIAGLTAAAIIGGVVGDRISYYVGGKAGARIRHGKLAAAKVKAEAALLRQGGVAIVIGRFIPYGRTAVTLTAGSVKMRWTPFYVGSLISNVLWAAYSIGLGRLGGVTFADSPILAACFGIALGFLIAGLHTLVKRLLAALSARRTGHETGAAVEETEPELVTEPGRDRPLEPASSTKSAPRWESPASLGRIERKRMSRGGGCVGARVRAGDAE